ncbi:MAG: M48 family metalloprotease, partial [Ignavibacteriales bacterium]|nr:M48 family metalloprotease [Ignavibacteriales bacterium]
MVDDAAVNAFAIPGGFIYVTRGIVSHLNSEAELAAILGHEIGHVTARHSVSQDEQAATGPGGARRRHDAVSRVRAVGNLAQVGLGLMFMKFSRSDESQSDALGTEHGYDGRRLRPPDARERSSGCSTALSQQSGDGRLPQWMSTHPDPGEPAGLGSERRSRALQTDLSRLAVNRPGALCGAWTAMFGENPREGSSRTSRSATPTWRSGWTSAGWKSSNEKRSVGAISPNEDAIVVLQLAPGPQRAAGGPAVLLPAGRRVERRRAGRSAGFPPMMSTFRVQTEQGYLRGLVAWIRCWSLVSQLPELTLASVA